MKKSTFILVFLLLTGCSFQATDNQAVSLKAVNFVHGQTAYANQRFGWWYLDWKIGDTTLEMRAPIAEFSLTDLLNLAPQLGAQ